MSKHYNKALDAAQLILYCSFIYWLSDQPTLATLMLFPHQDKLFHAGAYFILAALTLRTFKHIIITLPMLMITSLIFSSLYGLSDEWHQSFVSGRMSDIADWAADTLGAISFLSLYYWYRVRIIKQC